MIRKVRAGLMLLSLVVLTACNTQPVQDGFDQFMHDESQGFSNSLSTIGQQAGTSLGAA